MLRILLPIVLLFGFLPDAFADKCTYAIDTKDSQLKWTAFKTSKKLPVSGTFSQIDVKQKKAVPDLKQLFESLELSIHALKIESGNVARDKNLVDGFVMKMADPAMIKAKVLEHDVEKNTTKVQITMNGVSTPVLFQFSQKDDRLSWNAKIDLLREFKMKDSLNGLNAVCGELHKGPDGKSVSSPDVELEVSAKLYRYCP